MMQDLLKTHQRQQQDLQARIFQKKKNATKKTRKGIDEECTALERNLAEKQRDEVEALSNPNISAEEPPVHQEKILPQTSNSQKDVPVGEESRLSEQTASETTLEAFQDKVSPRVKKPNRQKARLARRAAEQQTAVEEAANEAINLPDHRQQERETMDRELKARGLVENEVRSDGHCMYAAVADQMKPVQLSSQNGDPFDYRAVRKDAARFIESHPDEFAPFMEEPLSEYIRKVRDTAEWGGHLELTALARAYRVSIKVLGGDGRLETIAGDEPPKSEIWLAYYRHSFGLGEHYNSLRRQLQGELRATSS